MGSSSLNADVSQPPIGHALFCISLRKVWIKTNCVFELVNGFLRCFGSELRPIKLPSAVCVIGIWVFGDPFASRIWLSGYARVQFFSYLAGSLLLNSLQIGELASILRDNPLS